MCNPLILSRQFTFFNKIVVAVIALMSWIGFMIVLAMLIFNTLSCFNKLHSSHAHSSCTLIIVISLIKSPNGPYNPNKPRFGFRQAHATSRPISHSVITL